MVHKINGSWVTAADRQSNPTIQRLSLSKNVYCLPPHHHHYHPPPPQMVPDNKSDKEA